MTHNHGWGLSPELHSALGGGGLSCCQQLQLRRHGWEKKIKPELDLVSDANGARQEGESTADEKIANARVKPKDQVVLRHRHCKCTQRN